MGYVQRPPTGEYGALAWTPDRLALGFGYWSKPSTSPLC